MVLCSRKDFFPAGDEALFEHPKILEACGRENILHEEMRAMELAQGKK